MDARYWDGDMREMHRRFGRPRRGLRWLGSVFILLPLILSLTLVMFTPVAAADVPITLGNQTPVGTLYINSTFTLDVTIGAVTNFDAGQFCITYNKDVLMIDSVTDGSLGGATGTVKVLNAEKVTDGTWVVLVRTPDLHDPLGVTGSGTLCTVHFTAVGVGSSPIDFADLPANPGPPPSGGPGSLMINDGTATPTAIAATWTEMGITVAQLTGDVDGNGTINSADILALGRIIVQLDPTKTAADVNGDGKVNCADITKIERIIRGLP